jgi:class 3 adenylate cyclase
LEDTILLAGSVVFAVGIALIVAGARRAIVQRAENERIRGIFARYFPSAIVDDLLARHDPDIFRGRAGRATVLVCRIWNFAHLLDGRTPADALKYLNEFYTVAGGSIQKHNGVIDKFLGDGLSAVFGMPPLKEEGQEENALRAAIDIVRLVNSLDARWRAERRVPLQVGIGINSGTIIAGDIGFKDRREFTAIGPEAILASLLQEHTAELNAYILATKSTIDPVREKFDVLQFDNIPLRGMRRLREVYVVRGLATAETDALVPPLPSDYQETSVAEAPPKPEPPPAEKPLPEKQPPPEPQLKKQPRPRVEMPPLVRPRTDKPPIDVPELRSGRVRRIDDVKPAMPDVPVPPALYEDNQGPPLSLPP